MVQGLCDVLYALLWDLEDDEGEVVDNMTNTRLFCRETMERVMAAEEGEILDDELNASSFEKLRQTALSMLWQDQKAFVVV